MTNCGCQQQTICTKSQLHCQIIYVVDFIYNFTLNLVSQISLLILIKFKQIFSTLNNFNDVILNAMVQLNLILTRLEMSFSSTPLAGMSDLRTSALT